MVCSVAQRRHLKLLFIAADKYPPFRVDVKVLFGEELSSRGHEIHWLLQAEDQLDKSRREEWVGGSVWVGATDTGSSLIAKVRKHALNLLHDLKLFGLVRNNRYDFVQVKDKFISALIALLACRINKTGFVYWLSYPFPEAMLFRLKAGTSKHPPIDWLRGRLQKIILYKIIIPRADHVFVQSRYMKTDMVEKGFPEGKFTAVPMGVSLEEVPAPTKESAQRNQPDSIAYLGDLSKARRMDFLLRVLALVLKQVDSARLYLVGAANHPSDVAKLKEYARELDVEDRVVFTGFLPRPEAWQYIYKTTVCVSPLYPAPTYEAATPTKLIEYMAFGKAVVANDHPDQKMVLDESGAGLCVPYEEAAFANAIVKLLRQPAKTIEMGLKGRDYVEKNRSYKVIADKVERKYWEMCRNQPTR